MATAPVPEVRRRTLNRAPPRPDARYVLYWMTAARRPTDNFALDRAIEWCRELSRPLLVLEALRAGYPHASDRLHRFVLDGMRDNSRYFARTGTTYYPYVEPRPGAGAGLLEALARDAAVVVTDDSPAFFLPRMAAAAAPRLPVPLEAVDGAGLYPIRAVPGIFPTAHAFRRHLHRHLPAHLDLAPRARPFAGFRPPPGPGSRADVRRRWRPASPALLEGRDGALAALEIDHSIRPTGVAGGREAARKALRRFVAASLDRYGAEASRPDADATSRLSPWLHFGHLSSHEVFAAVAAAAGFDRGAVNPRAGGRRRGFWGLPDGVEAYLDQLVTWRELGFHTAAKMPAYDRYETLPGWAAATLDRHEADPREHIYSEADLEGARTHDDLWNAAQTELVTEGRIHGYLRMLWGKKVLEWTPTPRHALRILLDLNDRYALDGRDPNSVSGIFWVLGRYDRAWGPERPVFGKVRYMSSANTKRKLPVHRYLERYGRDAAGGPAGRER